MRDGRQRRGQVHAAQAHRGREHAGRGLRDGGREREARLLRAARDGAARPERTVIEELIAAHSRASLGSLKTLARRVRLLGRRPREALSGALRRREGARGAGAMLFDPPNFLVLDEPTEPPRHRDQGDAGRRPSRTSKARCSSSPTIARSCAALSNRVLGFRRPGCAPSAAATPSTSTRSATRPPACAARPDLRRGTPAESTTVRGAPWGGGGRWGGPGGWWGHKGRGVGSSGRRGGKFGGLLFGSVWNWGARAGGGWGVVVGSPGRGWGGGQRGGGAVAGGCEAGRAVRGGGRGGWGGRTVGRGGGGGGGGGAGMGCAWSWGGLGCRIGGRGGGGGRAARAVGGDVERWWGP